MYFLNLRFFHMFSVFFTFLSLPLVTFASHVSEGEEDSDIPFIQVNPRPTLVTKYQDTFTLSPAFSAITLDLLRMNHLCYLIGKQNDKSIRYKIDDNDKWEDPQILEGKTGDGYFLDYPGLISYHPQENIIAVVLRGSRNTGDWITNFSGFFGHLQSLEAREEGFSFDGSFHPGFLKKYASFKKDLEEKLEGYFSKLNPQQLSSLQIIVTGHSQGGALATIASLDLVTDFLEHKFGPNFFNSEQNLLYGWYLSAPIVTKYSAINSIIGKNNIIFQTVLLDFATKIGTRNFVQNIFNASAGVFSSILGYAPSNPEETTFIEKQINKFSGLISQYIPEEVPGRLAIDYTLETLVRGYELSLKDVRRKCFERGDSPLPLIGSMLFPSASTYYDLFCSFIAPTHYGTTVHGSGGAFDFNLVITNAVETNLIKGHYFKHNIPLPKILDETNISNSFSKGLASVIQTSMHSSFFHMKKMVSQQSQNLQMLYFTKPFIVIKGIETSYNLSSIIYKIWQRHNNGQFQLNERGEDESDADNES